ncbi:putative Voltage-dependent calcium channel subunit alpha-2/delta-2 [Hypsibius exemplaris]|uniref:Voltage-dependent calcium channel subunit alpha-2/delta-2 n=1 Tax=Hypsibius exemplaris TaxID=2072580 RepID=A0A9X6NDM7_HYPEX|nr:putative Voltage-dependent calcium channel subunit alpha-2/delta-2 [Hypsibius exemplaris]
MMMRMMMMRRMRMAGMPAMPLPVMWKYVILWMSLWSLALLGTRGELFGSTPEEQPNKGTLSGDVQNWATLIQNYILELANLGIGRDVTQRLFDSANYTFEAKDGDTLLSNVQTSLGDFLMRKRVAAERIAMMAVKLHDEYLINKRMNRTAKFSRLRDMPMTYYRDSDIPHTVRPKMFSTHFKQDVNQDYSTVKIPDQVPRDDESILDAVQYTVELDGVFRQNRKSDQMIRWQYFGTNIGLIRLYPGREWDTNFAGFYNDYDPRIRPWHIAASSGPKDVVIVLDCSASMIGKKFDIAKSVAITVINTLTKQDWVNIVCARESHWDSVGQWHYYTSEVLGCLSGSLVPATNAHRKDLIEKVSQLQAGGTSELEIGFRIAFDLLQSKPRSHCQSIIVFVTDGKDIDNEEVRCAPGYYTRSGYVPGPVCRYNWTKVWTLSEQRNAKIFPKARIFSFLTVDDGEIFPGKLSCMNDGVMVRLSDGEDLINKMRPYFDYLSQRTMEWDGLWTAPYLDAWGLGVAITYAVPAVSKITGRTIGVAGVDATLEEIEHFLIRYQWGAVYTFIINKQGETILHPKLKNSLSLLEDPIFITISQLEQDKGHPRGFSEIEKDLRNLKKGHKTIFKNGENITYYYGGAGGEYGFAFVLTKSDQIYRRAQEPQDYRHNTTSFWNLLIEYNSTLARDKLPGVYEHLEVRYNDSKYPLLTVSEKHSSIFFAPKCHCDPNKYFFDEELDDKTVHAHKYINLDEPDAGCDGGGQYEKGLRADVKITYPIEEYWASRQFEWIDQIKWTYVGMRSGVFRTYPGHRSTRLYDATTRAWFKRAKRDPTKTVISNAYMDSAGVGKIITISQAVFEGLPVISQEECVRKSEYGPWPGGCECKGDNECISRRCYMSGAAKFANDLHPRCATERVEAVTSLDMLYNDFYHQTVQIMESTDDGKKDYKKRGCGRAYKCPDNNWGCQTRCYLFDNEGYILTDDDFVSANDLDEKKYKEVSLGKKEGEIMKELVYKYGLFVRKEYVDFQGTCTITPYTPKVTLSGIPMIPEEQDDYYKFKGPIPAFSNSYGCIQDVVHYEADNSKLKETGMLTGNISGPCMSGFYYVTALPKTNLFVLVIENWKRNSSDKIFNFNCKITQSLVTSGAFRIINGTCSAREDESNSRPQLCPLLKNESLVNVTCDYNASNKLAPRWWELSWCLFYLLLMSAPGLGFRSSTRGLVSNTT